MKFIKETLKKFSFDADASLGAQYFVSEGFGGYFENVKGVERLAPDEIVILFKTGALLAAGENLAVKKYCDGDMFIEGNILKVEKLRS